MSSLFNYELDEKNIRSTLQNARHGAFTEASWNDFEENFSKQLSKQQSTSFIKLPEIHLNINRNVILPLFFILALVGVSAIMLSFIDFKSADEQVEKKLEPNADNFKPTVKKAAAAPIKKMEVAQPKLVTAVPKKDTVVATTVRVQQPVSSELAASSNTLITEPKDQTQQSVLQSKTAESTSTMSAASSTNTSQNAYHRVRRKKAEKVPEEQLETIKAPTLIKEEAETAEPELEIKID